MADISGASEAAVNQGRVVWSSERTALTVAAGLPGIVVPAVVLGILGSGFFAPSVALAASLSIAGLVVGFRVVTCTLVVAKRSVVITLTHLEVRRGSKSLSRMAWSDMECVRLVPGSSLWRMAVDFTTNVADFPRIAAKPRDRWSVEGGFPTLLAVLPGEFRRLEAALSDACAERSVPFAVGDPLS